MEITGIKVVSFNGQDGKPVEGVKLYVLDHTVTVLAGVACDSLFLSRSLLDKLGMTPDDFKVGDKLTVIYNKYGKIQAVSVN